MPESVMGTAKPSLLVSTILARIMARTTTTAGNRKVRKDEGGKTSGGLHSLVNLLSPAGLTGLGWLASLKAYLM